MEFRKITPDTITQDQFEQIIAIEQNCGLEPYPPCGPDGLYRKSGYLRLL